MTELIKNAANIKHENPEPFYEIRTLLAKGGFAKVFRADAVPSLLRRTTVPVAVKQPVGESQQAMHELHREVDILTRCSHAHLLPLLGFCLDPRGPCLIYPMAVRA